jgi:hypothetical protein
VPQFGNEALPERKVACISPSSRLRIADAAAVGRSTGPGALKPAPELDTSTAGSSSPQGRAIMDEVFVGVDVSKDRLDVHVRFPSRRSAGLGTTHRLDARFVLVHETVTPRCSVLCLFRAQMRRLSRRPLLARSLANSCAARAIERCAGTSLSQCVHGVVLI